MTDESEGELWGHDFDRCKELEQKFGKSREEEKP
jgi:hypothetical protein